MSNLEDSKKLLTENEKKMEKTFAALSGKCTDCIEKLDRIENNIVGADRLIVFGALLAIIVEAIVVIGLALLGHNAAVVKW